MAVMQEYLQKLILRQISEVGLVVWYDPQEFYRDLVSHLDLPGVQLAGYQGSFLALRVAVEPFLNQPEATRLLVYAAMDSDKTQHALIELESPGIILKPGAVPSTCNTRPSYIARQVLQPILGEETAQSIEKQVEEGKLGLLDLEELAEQGAGLSKGVVSLIFGTGNPQDVALAFLASDKYDEDLKAKDVLPELAGLLQTVYEYRPAALADPAEYRKAFTRFVLASELVHRMPIPLPVALFSVPAAAKPSAREACATLAQTWRNRRDISASYEKRAMHIESGLHLKDMVFSLDQLMAAETFLGLEQRLMEEVTTKLVEEFQDALVSFAETRQSTFWPEQYSELQAQWALIVIAGRVVLEARKIEKELRMASKSGSAELAKRYTEAEEPWSLLDTYHRNMERRIHQFDFDITSSYRPLEQLIAEARAQYMKTGNLLAERFVQAYSADKFMLSGFENQKEIFEKQLKAHLLRGKVAFVWVDALRYEMGRELAANLEGEFEVTFQPAVASVPTLTEIGMASLLPLPKEAPELFSPAESKLALMVDGTPIKDRKDRIAFLHSHTFLKTTDLRLDELLPSPKKAVRDAIKTADLVLVTSQEIDELCEGDNVHLARRIMDDMLLELRRAFRILRDLGVKTIVCTADHGHLFGDEIGVDMKIDPPGGNTVDLHRRVWIGQGGAADPAYLRAPLSQFGWKTELEIAAPWNFACFKVKGGTKAYFHGGLSPQELFIPVLTILPMKKQVSEAGGYSWKLSPGTSKISTRFYSVQIAGEAVGLFESKTPKVRIEVRSGNDTLSTAISASYGFSDATGDVQLRSLPEDPRKIDPNTVTLMITKELVVKKITVDVVLFEAETGVELSRLAEVEMVFSI